MGRLDLRLLGAPRVVLDGEEREFRTKKALALLAYLAVEGGTHRRDWLAELLWPSSRGGRGRTTLRSALARIRRALGEGEAGPGEGLLLADGDTVGLRPGPEVGLDVEALREASAAARAAARGAEGNGLLPKLRSAEAAFRGEFLEGLELDDAPEFGLWLEGQRTACRSLLEGVSARLFGLEYEAGELAEAAATARRWAGRDPLDGAAWAALMGARSAAGDPRGALEAFAEYGRRVGALGLEPAPEAEALAARARAQSGTALVGDRRAPQGAPQGPLRMPFAGRGGDFGALVAEYRAARTGQTRAVVLVGEAGIGKTRLAEEFLGWAAAQGADVMRGRSFETGPSFPYETVVGTLRPRLEKERSPDDLLDDRWLAELSRIMPELSDRYPDLPPPTADEALGRALLFEAAARLGAALARPGGTAGGAQEPLVVFGDDLQWADGSSLDVMGYCCRAWARDGVPLLLVVTVREEDLATGGLDRRLSALGRELPFRRLALSPMDEGDVRGLLRVLSGSGAAAGAAGRDGDPAWQEDLGRWLLGQSDGHPLFLAQIVGDLLDRGVLVERAGADGGREVALSERGFDGEELRGVVPAGLRGLILDKLGPLPAHASDMLSAGAVLGSSFGFGSLLAVAGLGESDGLAALDGLVSARLLQEAGPERRGAYAFAHDKVREVAYTEAGEARRTIFHRRALEHLQELSAPAAALVRHAVAAGLDEKAFYYLLAAAGEAMAVFAAGDAVGFYERALGLLKDRPRGAPPVGAPERLRLYEGLGRARALSRDFARAQEAYGGMLAVAREAGDQEAEWKALSGLTTLGVEVVLGPDDLERRRRVGRRGGPGERVEASKPRPALEAGYGTRVAREYAEEALRLANDLGREDLVVRSEFALGAACTWAHDWAGAATHLERVPLPAVPQGGEPADAAGFLRADWSRRVAAWGRALADGPDGAFGPAGVLRKRWRESAEILAAMETENARAQLNGQALQCVVWGDYDGALDMAPRGIEASLSLGEPGWLTVATKALGDAYREMLALPQARETYTKRLDTSDPVPRWAALSVESDLCAVSALEGDWERAHAHALGAVGIEEELYLPLTHLHHHHDVEALLRGGDADLAREGLRVFERRTRGQGGYFRLAYLRADAVLARWEGDADKALSHLREALASAERLGLPGETWQVGAALGEAHEERGEDGTAGEAFGRSAAVIRRLAENISDDGLREGYLAAPRTRRVLERVSPARKA